MLHNLLHREQKEALRYEYYIRVAIVAAVVFSGAILVGTVALVPAYIDVTGELQIVQVEQGVLGVGSLGDGKDTAITDSLQVSVALLTELDVLRQQSRLTDLINEVFTELPEGIVITGMSYDRAQQTLGLEGVAHKRELLVSYTRRLESNLRFSDVSLPISNLAQNTDLDFHISMKLVETTQKQ